MLNRKIDLPKNGSFILLGPRQTGKSTLVHSVLPQDSWEINLLLTDVFLKYSKEPSLFRKEALEKIQREGITTIFLDEIQKVPQLLDEVQFLMDKTKCQFILTGSSARKLRRGHANLLAGRAVERFLFPFTYSELKKDFDLNKILLFGSLPPLLGKNEKQKRDILSAYVHVYLKEEIQSEGIARNLGGFSRFLDLAASQCGELVSFSAIAREVQLPVRTVQSYYQILEDTLLGFCLEPWHKSIRKRLVAHPKFYFFDLGVVNAINKRLTAAIDRQLFGKLFEQFIVLEFYRNIHYFRSETRIYFWRTNHGAEVDMIVEKHGKITAALEIKSSAHISGADLSGLRAFRQENHNIPCYLICSVENSYELDGVKIISWKKFLDSLMFDLLR